MTQREEMTRISFDDIVMGCENVLKRLDDCVAFHSCEDVGELETYHDNLVSSVRDLVSLVQSIANALATLRGEAGPTTPHRAHPKWLALSSPSTEE